MTTTGPNSASHELGLGDGRLIELFQEAAGSSEALEFVVRNPVESRHLFFEGGRVKIYAPERASRLLGEFAAEQPDSVSVARYQDAEDLYALFSWRQGSCERVDDGTTDPLVEARVAKLPSFDCHQVLEEVTRREKEWKLVLGKIYSIDEIFVVRPDCDRSLLDQRHALVLDALDGERSVRNLPDVTMLSLFDCARAVRDLYDRNLVTLANDSSTMDAAEVCLEHGDVESAIVIIRALLERPGGIDLETMQKAAELLERCDSRTLAARAMLKASQLDPTGRAIDYARKACSLAPQSVEALQFLREQLVGIPRSAEELKDVSRRLANAYVQAGQHDQALQLNDELAAQDPTNVLLLSKRASILHKLGRRDEAVECLLTLSGILENEGDREGAARTLEQIRRIDRSRTDAARALRRLRARGLTKFVLRLGDFVSAPFRARRRVPPVRDDAQP